MLCLNKKFWRNKIPPHIPILLKSSFSSLFIHSHFIYIYNTSLPSSNMNVLRNVTKAVEIFSEKTQEKTKLMSQTHLLSSLLVYISEVMCYHNRYLMRRGNGFMRITKQQWKQNNTPTLAENSVTTSTTAKLCLSLKKKKEGKKEEGKEEGIKDLPSKLLNCLNFYTPFLKVWNVSCRKIFFKNWRIFPFESHI